MNYNYVLKLGFFGILIGKSKEEAMGDYITKVKQLFEAAGSSWWVCVCDQWKWCNFKPLFVTWGCSLLWINYVLFFYCYYVIYSRNSWIYFYSCGYFKVDFYIRMVMMRGGCMDIVLSYPSLFYVRIDVENIPVHGRWISSHLTSFLLMSFRFNIILLYIYKLIINII